MDDIIKTNDNKSNLHIPSSAVLLVVLTVILGISAYTAMTLAEGSGLVQDMNFYGRYTSFAGITGLPSLLSRLTEALINSVPVLVQILTLFLLSFSPLLIPAGVTVTVFRGILAGIALCKVGSTPEAVQPCFYLAVSLIVCFMCSSFLRCHGDPKLSVSSRTFRKTAIFLISSGACVTAEIVLSFVM